jgi:hypothetical protein
MDASKMGKLSLIRFCLAELVDFPVNLLKIYLRKHLYGLPFNLELCVTSCGSLLHLDWLLHWIHLQV